MFADVCGHASGLPLGTFAANNPRKAARGNPSDARLVARLPLFDYIPRDEHRQNARHSAMR
jgi:hypothetical protein